MIAITIEKWLYGYEKLAEQIAVVIVGNVTPGKDPADYCVQVFDEYHHEILLTEATDHDRDTGIWPLLTSVFTELEAHLR